ncbi:hypothetical protein DM01DRAFT_1203391 [Hesseltinella vesiculosa]|uniref:Methyltransferase type 11 domain-containing protein n=1 Tax=Hesseltinella vesiculosa TaxID=101127 RepID=A0A1X2G2R9_9FUNG|nr:hypothetical protein DM01DRAFT_1203391 [Hesseltinella vesiculosa]
MEDLTGGQFPPSALRYRNAAITSGGLDRLNGLPRNTHGNYQFIRSPTTLLDGLAWLPDGFFDLVYGQCLLLTLPKKDYKAMVSHAWRVCKPGGYVELTELDPILYAQFPLGKLTRWLNQRMLCVTKKQRLDPTMARHLQDLFFELLIQDQPSRQRQHYEVAYTSLPLGVWGGRIGVTFRDDLHDLWDALKVATLPVKSEEDPLSEQEWEDMTGTLDDTLDTEKCFMNLYQFYTKKHA